MMKARKILFFCITLSAKFHFIESPLVLAIKMKWYIPVILFTISKFKLYELLNNNIQQMHIHEEVPWQQIAVQSGMIECWAFCQISPIPWHVENFWTLSYYTVMKVNCHLLQFLSEVSGIVFLRDTLKFRC